MEPTSPFVPAPLHLPSGATRLFGRTQLAVRAGGSNMPAAQGAELRARI